jgi:membrane-bound lytic murein transglycosylase D
MTRRTRFLIYCLGVLVVLGIAGCGYNQSSTFRNAFLPSVPHTPAILAPPPVVEPNIYLHDAPAILLDAQKPIEGPTEADLLIVRAEQAFQRGKKAYQAKQAAEARQEFDTAVSLMLDASAGKLTDRQAFEARLDEMVDNIHRYDLAGLGAGADVEQADFEKAPLEDILQMTFPVDPRLKDKVQEQAQATASQLPLSVNDAVSGYVNYFSGRGRSTLIAGLERAGRYRGMIERVLAEEGIPLELIHLAQAESGFLPRAVSRKAAAGMWQFVAWRGQEYGLHQTRYTDDRFDPEKATRASAKHLHDLYKLFGDWYLAIAAYNCGPGVVEKAVERTGYADFWELRKRKVLPLETTNYVPIILAMTIMTKNAGEYGLTEVAPDSALEYDTIQVSSATHMALVADLTDAPVSELLQLNPAILKGVVPEGYPLHVPKGSGSALAASLEMIPAERRASWRMHTVSSGETLASIGRHYGTAASRIVAANNLGAAAPQAGERLLIPVAERQSSTTTKKVTTKRSAKNSHRLPVLARTASARRLGSAGGQ